MLKENRKLQNLSSSNGSPRSFRSAARVENVITYGC